MTAEPTATVECSRLVRRQVRLTPPETPVALVIVNVFGTST